jgi:hypothetical protein
VAGERCKLTQRTGPVARETPATVCHERGELREDQYSTKRLIFPASSTSPNGSIGDADVTIDRRRRGVLRKGTCNWARRSVAVTESRILGVLIAAIIAAGSCGREGLLDGYSNLVEPGFDASSTRAAVPEDVLEILKGAGTSKPN